ncbi:hypothetical protein J437_LFUL002727 [Ladona fulva]|uniref:Uncharacterized protein n=1 Tax=Ladona fulva TaxID=123851 RepID=A0A8K0K5C3_LADFU|nr:hypothetical protein J437_LFUL002727 [Ladona fulva]
MVRVDLQRVNEVKEVAKLSLSQPDHSGPLRFSQLSDNTPPVMVLDRNWDIPDNESVGAVVTRVRAQDNEGDRLQFGIEKTLNSPRSDLPFNIDKDRGVVYINQSLEEYPALPLVQL